MFTIYHSQCTVQVRYIFPIDYSLLKMNWQEERENLTIYHTLEIYPSFISFNQRQINDNAKVPARLVYSYTRSVYQNYRVLSAPLSFHYFSFLMQNQLQTVTFLNFDHSVYNIQYKIYVIKNTIIFQFFLFVLMHFQKKIQLFPGPPFPPNFDFPYTYHGVM